MKSCAISCTGLPKDVREDIAKKVTWMSGEVTKDFHDGVTHLIAGEVGSKKYRVAANLKRRILSVNWVDSLLEMSKQKLVHANDPEFLQKYKCPVFKGLVVTVSGLDLKDRNELKEMIDAEGGRYTGEMKMNECTHLIIKRARGQKYEFALKWKLHIVTPKWVFKSMETGYCQDEEDFKVQDDKGEVQHPTSTPNRELGGHPCLSTLDDVSAISMAHVDESAMMNNTTNHTLINQPGTSRTDTIQKTDSLDALDLSACEGSFFLDGCSIFVTGFTGKQMEKLKKMINLAGAIRSNEITECVSHVIVGKQIDEHITRIQQLSSRPFMLKIEWLVESLKAKKSLPENDYLCEGLSVDNTIVEKEKEPKKKQSKSNSGGNESFRAPSSSQVMAADDMHQIMSQYLPQGENMSTMGDTTLMQMDLGEEKSNEESKAQRIDKIPNLEDMETQDPNDETELQENDIFQKKTFIIDGFDQEQTKDLEKFILDYGGVIAAVNTRRIPDYAIVPIMGVPVQRTVNEIVTNAWLQMSVEEGEILPVDTNPIFTPINPKDESAKPLDGLVISISGYNGTERDVLFHITEILGALSQEFFVRKAKDSYHANTHLIVNSAEGSKYNAAKKWKIPAVDKSWLIACAKQSKRMSEENYLVDKPKKSSESDSSDNPPLVQQQHKDSASKQEGRTPSQEQMPPPVSLPLGKVVKQQQALKRQSDDAPETPSPAKYRRLTRQGSSAAVDSSSSTSSDTSPQDAKIKNSKTRKSSKSSTDEDSDRTLSEDELQSNVKGNTNINSDQNMVAGQSDNLGVNSDAVTAQDQLLTEKNRNIDQNRRKSLTIPKVQQLIIENRKQTPKAASCDSNKIEVDEWEVVTPSRLCDQGETYKPNLSLTDVYSCLENMDTPGRTPRAQRRNKLEQSLEDALSQELDMAVKNSTRLENIQHRPPESPAAIKISTPLPLAGVVMVVGKKLLAKQSDYNNIAASLGADYRWKYDSSVTHYIFQGRQNDMNKEFRQARDSKKKIVSPHWLLACQQENRRVDESLYPHTYNPNLSLSITTTKTPIRSTRSTRNSSKQQSLDMSTENRCSSTTAISTPSTIKRSTRTRHFQPVVETSDNEVSTHINKTAKSRVKYKGNSINEETSAESTSSDANSSLMDQSGQGLSSEKTKVLPSTSSYKSSSTGDINQFNKTPSLNSISKNIEAENKDESRKLKTADMDECNNSKSDSLMNDLKTLMAATGGGAGNGAKSYGNKTRTRKWKSSESFDRLGGAEDDNMNDSAIETPNKDGGSGGSTGREKELEELGTKSRSSSALGNPRTTPVETQASQIIEVCWDDPKAREQQEKLAIDLAKQSQSLSPCMETHSIVTMAPSTTRNQLQKRQSDDNQSSDSDNKNKTKKRKSKEERTPTPEAPSLAFPLPKTNLQSPQQKQEVIELEDKSLDNEKHPQPPVFLMSGIDPRERVDYSELISRLGGEVLDSQNFDPSTTHLIVAQPNRNEKYLAAVATGKWILHKSYLEACRNENAFVDEEQFEWGSDNTLQICKTDIALKLAKSARKWRLKIKQQKKKNGSCRGAFSGWKILLYTSKGISFKRLLEAGGAEVVSTQLPFTNLKNISYAFIDNKLAGQVDLESLISADILCCKLEFIAGYLIEDPAPKPDQYFVDGVSDYLS